MLKSYERILVVTDGMKTSESVHKSALKIAQQHHAQIVLVDTVEPPTTTAKWFSPNANQIFEMVVSDKQVKLETIAKELRREGLEVATKILFGTSSKAITNEVIQWKASLVIRYRKGFRSKFPGLFGHTARNL
ncbi:MAG: universal stress protein, partial [Planctomycetota bacterium]